MLQDSIFENLITGSNIVIITDNYNQKKVKEYYSSLKDLTNYQVYSESELRMIAFPSVSDKGLLKLLDHDYHYIMAKTLIQNLPTYIFGTKVLNIPFVSKHHQEELEKVFNFVQDDISLPNEQILMMRFQNKKVYAVLETPTYEIMLVLKYLEQLGIEINSVDLTSNNLNTISKYTYYKCSSVHEEIDCMVNRIGYLLAKNVRLDNIRVIYGDESYLANITNALELIELPYTIDNSVELKAYEQVKRLIAYLKEYEIHDTNIQTLQTDLFNNVELDLELKVIVTRILNNYVDFELSTNLIKILIDKINNKKVWPKKTTGILISSEIERAINEKYLIYLGAYNNVLPAKHEVDSYFTEHELYTLLPFTIVDANKNSRNYLDSLLNNIEYAYFTTSSKLGGYLTVPSFYLKNAVKYEIIAKDKYIYFDKHQYQKYEEFYDDYRNYNAQSDVFCSLNDLYKEERIKKYNNTFTGINQNVVSERFIDNEVSYTQIDNYYSCPFKYYLSYYWGVKEEPTNALFIGNLFHHVMEYLVKNNIQSEDIDLKIDEYTKEYVIKAIEKQEVEPSTKLDVFLDIYKPYIKRCYEFHLRLINTFQLELHGTEHNVKFDIQVDGYKINVFGKLDKVLKADNYYLIVDYKTGTLHLDFGKNEYGLNMQLPFYLYLLNNDLSNQDFRFMGAFLQQVLPTKPVDHDDKKTKDQTLDENLKFKGIEINHNDDLYQDVLINHPDDFIKSMVKRGDKKINFEQKELKEYIDFVESKIIEACHQMINGNFDIAPKSFGISDNACMYCNFKGICYKRSSNVVKVEKDDTLSFIFGKKEEEHE